MKNEKGIMKSKHSSLLFSSVPLPSFGRHCLRVSLFSVLILFLVSCENIYVQSLLSRPAQLSVLAVTAFVNTHEVSGGASLEPAFLPGVYEYTVYIPLEVNGMDIEAIIRGTGSGTVTMEGSDDFSVSFPSEESFKEVLITVQQRHMETSEYKLTFLRSSMPMYTLTALNVDAWIGNYHAEGGSSLVPALNPSDRQYRAYVPLDSSRVAFSATLRGPGTVTFNGTDSDGSYAFPKTQDTMTITFRVNWAYVEPDDYTITVMRGDTPMFYLTDIAIESYMGNQKLEGLAPLSPAFGTVENGEPVKNYTAQIPPAATRIIAEAFMWGNGTLEWIGSDSTGGYEFSTGENTLNITLKVHWLYVPEEEYHITVIRQDAVPAPTNIAIAVTPSTGAFFLGSGAQPRLTVTADAPPAGGALSYQWYRNSDNNNQSGEKILGATNATYTLTAADTSQSGTTYYYAVVTNTVGAFTASMESSTQFIAIIDKGTLSNKSITMVTVPAGSVTAAQWNKGAWTTPAFKMGECLVTWELWKLVYDYADAGPYRFIKEGQQGWCSRSNGGFGDIHDGNYGTPLHPVIAISWRDVIIWCNAYSEMEGKEPAYRDTSGNVVRNARPVQFEEQLAQSGSPYHYSNYNGYRLPSDLEYEYAWRGAKPNASAASVWQDPYPGEVFDNYILCFGKWIFGQGTVQINDYHSIEVGSLLPNSIGLYDMGHLRFFSMSGSGSYGDFNIFGLVAGEYSWEYRGGIVLAGYGSARDGFRVVCK